jgi:hypothetical protein
MQRRVNLRIERLFLSHAAESPASLQLVSGVVRELSCAGYDVFEYRHTVQAGQPWRVALLTALLFCQVSVILVDARSRKRRWLRYEKGILDERGTTPFGKCAVIEIDVAADSDPGAIAAALRARGGWMLLPADQTFAELLERALPMLPADLDEVQCKKCIETLMVQGRIADVLEKLAPHLLPRIVEMLESGKPSPVANLDVRILDELEKLTSGSDCGSERMAGYRVAKRLTSDPEQTLPVFFRETHLFLSKDSRRAMLDLLAPLLVPLGSVEPLAALFSREIAADKPLYLESSHAGEAAAAVRRAWGVERGPSYRAPVIQLSYAGEEDARSAVDAQIRETLQHTVGLERSNDYELDRALGEIAPRLNTDDQNEDLWILILPSADCTPELFGWLRMRYPEFPVLLTGKRGQITSPDVVFVGSIPEDVHVRLTHLYRLAESFDERM